MKDKLLDYIKALKYNDKEKKEELKAFIPKEIREAIEDILIKGKTDPKALRRKKQLRMFQRQTLIEKRKELENELKNWNDILFLVLCGALPMYPEARNVLNKYIQTIEHELNNLKEIYNI